MTCNDHSNDDGSIGAHPAHLADFGSAADLVNALAKIIESGASKEDIDALIGALTNTAQWPGNCRLSKAATRLHNTLRPCRLCRFLTS